jgi:hypothetical protein
MAERAAENARLETKRERTKDDVRCISNCSDCETAEDRMGLLHLLRMHKIDTGRTEHKVKSLYQLRTASVSQSAFSRIFPMKQNLDYFFARRVRSALNVRLAQQLRSSMFRKCLPHCECVPALAVSPAICALRATF